MNLISRVSRIFKADLHGILDVVEEPKAVLRQAVREMEEEIAMDEAHVKGLERQEEGLEQAKQDYVKQLKELEQEIGFCLDRNNDNLAKFLIRRKLEVNQYLKQISFRFRCVNDEKILILEELKERREKLKSIRDKQEIVSHQSGIEGADRPQEIFDTVRFKTISEEDVELEFLHQKQLHTVESDRRSKGE